MSSLVISLLLLLLGASSSSNAAANSYLPTLVNFLPATTTSGLPIQTLPIDRAFDPTMGLNELDPMDHQPDSETIAAYSLSGQCFSYLGRLLPEDVNEAWNRDKELEPCKNYCQNSDPENGYGCNGPNITSITQLDPSVIYTDDDNLHWTPGRCDCDYELAVVIMDIIAQGLEKLDMVLCSIFVSIFEEVVEVATMFLPGADLLDAMQLAITAAKTVDENALGPTDYFDNWLNNQCGMTGLVLDPISMFALLVGASDGLGTSKGCSRKKPANCVKPKAHPDPAKDVPRPSAKDPWDGETPPKSDVPPACANTRLGLLQARTKCKSVPDIEAEGYTYKDLTGMPLFERGTWAIKCPSKTDNTQLSNIACLHIDKDNNVLSVDYANLATTGPDSIGKLKLRDMMAGIWNSKGSGGVDTIEKVVHLTVVEKGWVGRELSDRGTRGRVQDLLGKQDWEEYSMRVDATGVEKQAFDIVLKETSQGVGVFKMLEEYAGGAGRQVTLIEILKGGGRDDMHFTIGQGTTP
ncbi:unnamed protein product [Discula destructiva]